MLFSGFVTELNGLGHGETDRQQVYRALVWYTTSLLQQTKLMGCISMLYTA